MALATAVNASVDVVSAMGANSSASGALGNNYFSDRGAWDGYMDSSVLARAWQHFDRAGLSSTWTREGNGLSIGGAGNDRISSVWVKDGYRLRLWQHNSGGGLSGTFYGGYSNLNYNPGGHIPDQASDADIEKEAPCTIFEHDRGLASAGGWFDARDVGVLYSNLGSMDNKVDSLYVAPGYKCTLYKDVGEGTSKTYYPGWHMYHELVHDGLRDQASSIKVEHAPTGYLEFAPNAKAIAWQHFQSGERVAWSETGRSLSLSPVPDNQISSVWVKDGYRLFLWDHPNRGGAVATFYGGYTTLMYRGEWLNDRVSDVDVFDAAPCTLFDGDVGAGAWFDLWELDRIYSVQDFNAIGFDNRAASLYVASGYKCTLWNGDISVGELSEPSHTFYPGWHYALDFQFGLGGWDRTSSAQVSRITSSAAEEGCYPSTGYDMVFPANSHQHLHRLVVRAGGDVKYDWGNTQHGWTSISNVAYAVKGRRPLQLASGWRNHGGSYSTPSYSCADGIVSLGGTIIGSSNSVGSLIATLPSGCRPTRGTLLFNAAGFTSAGIVRVDVLTSGEIKAHIGHAVNGVLSLEGIVFAVDGNADLTLVNNWFNLNDGYAPLQVRCGGGLVMLSGLVRPGRWGACITNLPAQCRPREWLIFSVNTHRTQSRITVRASDGCVYTEAADESNGWISLSNIVFTTGRKERAPLDRWYNYGNGWEEAHYTCARGGLVVLEGLIKPRDWWGVMFTLPNPPATSCSLSPPADTLFTANQDTSTQRLDLNKDGGVYLHAGYRNGAWSTLTSIHWANSQRDATLHNGWSNRGSGYSPAKYSCEGGLVTVSGLVNAGRWGYCILYLPIDCRPENGEDLMFTVNNHDKQSRVRVRGSDGCVYKDDGTGSYGWLSLSGIIFSTTQNRALMLENGWVNHLGGWASARYSCVDGLVVLGGLIKDGAQGHVATLPPGCRPKTGALLFTANHHQYQWRVNIYPTGEIHAGGTQAHAWLSLSGISFSTSDAQHRLHTASDWSVHGGGWAPPQFSCVRGIMSLQGLVKPLSGRSSGNYIGSIRYEYPPPPSPPPSPPPPSPPPSPPPPSPPPPGSKTEVTVKLANPARLVSTFSYDFGVRVTHPFVCNGDCLESAVAREKARAAGLRCIVTVQKDDTNCEGKWSNVMPCRQWNDFSPKSLEMVDDAGRILPGDYTIRSSCHFVLANENRVRPPEAAQTIIHRFRLLAGCSDHIPAGIPENPLETVARYLLLTADEFNVADCRDQVEVYKTKEAIFRRYDNNPEDGKLSRDEIAEALMQQSADTHILDLWNEDLDGALELKLSQVMRAKTNDMECGTGYIVYHDAVYPTDSPGRESSDEQCRQNATFMRVSWRYSTPPALGDYVCLYIDGLLYDKRSASQTAQSSKDYSLHSNGLYASTELTDIRPVSGSYEDTQQSLVANFVFDDDDALRIVSSSPTVIGSKNRVVPNLTPIDRDRPIGRCEGGDGALCLKPVESPVNGAQYGYRYKEFDFMEDVAITSWVRGTCSGRAGVDLQRMSIAYFSGVNAGIHHVLRFYVKTTQSNTLNLILEYTQNSATIYRLELSGISCGIWQYVGFSLNKRDRMVLFTNPTGDVDATGDTSTYKVHRSMAPDVPSKILRLMTSLDLFGAIDVEFDDARVYSGQVSRATFIDAFNCGHRSLCTKRAHARPSSRRVVCANAVVSGQKFEQQTDTFCTAALYYDGAAIDVMATLGMSGVTFTYRDTSWQETSFEMLRKSVDGSAASYETVIQMDGDLLGCVNKFNSITHIDRDAGVKPNLSWYYKIRTKTTADAQDFVSTTHFFKVPWIGVLEGKVTAGSSTSPVAYVRVCADFSLPDGTLVTPKSDTKLRNLALFMRAEHTSDIVKTAREDTYLITDGDPTPEKGYALMSQGEYLRVELARWSSISSVEVCVVTGSYKPLAYVQEYDSGASGDHGNACERDDSLTLESTSHTCFQYRCAGSHLPSFHGKFITASVPRSEGIDGDLPMDGLYAWFESHNAGAIWPSSVGNLRGEVVQGEVTVKAVTGYGSSYPVRALHGNGNSQFDLGRALPQGNWTLCTVSRYDGPLRGRIIQGSGNLFHGHHDAKRGVAYYEGWMSRESVGSVTDWNVMCGTNNGRVLFVDEVNVAQNDLRGAASNKYLGINYAKDACCAGERSDWAVAEVMTWSRTLSEDEMKRVTRYLRTVTLGPKAQVTEISVSGLETNCRFTDVSDAGGNYEVFLKDTSEAIPAKTNILVGAYKEETFPREKVQLVEASGRAQTSSPSQQVLLILVKQTGSQKSPAPRLFAAVDLDNSTRVSRSELQAHIEAVAGFPTTGHAIIHDFLWKEFDSDGDGALNSEEFNAVSVKMLTGALKVDPLLVYPIIDATYLSDFNEERESSQVCANFALVRYHSSMLPRNSTEWNTFYEQLISDKVDPVAATRGPCNQARKMTAPIGNANLTRLLPLLGQGPKRDPISLETDATVQSEVNVYSRVISTGTPSTLLKATQRYRDVVHLLSSGVYSKSTDLDENLFSPQAKMNVTEIQIRHRSAAEVQFQDETTVIVRGAVLFPKSLVADSTRCGLYAATVKVQEVDGEGEPEEYKTDESGWFDIAVTRGKSFTFTAIFPNHTLCYTGKTVADATAESSCSSHPNEVTLVRLIDNAYIFFTDVTRANIDLGLYEGQCEQLYKGAIFKITPINGCHASQYVTSADVSGWMTNVKGLPDGKFTDDEPMPKNARVWPYAAMDYSIILHEGPDLGPLGDKIKAEPWYEGCATEAGSVVDFFRRRNALERLALMRDENAWQQVRFKYHGWICVDIPDLPVISSAYEDAMCYDENQPSGSLTSKHFIGTSHADDLPFPVYPDSEVRVKIFEIHANPGSEKGYETCFAKLPDKQKGTGSTIVKIRQDVSNPEDSECHSERGGGVSCDFQVALTKSGELIFPDSAQVNESDALSTSMVISAGAPNLAGNHRRVLSVEVTRNDLFVSVAAKAIRNLIPLGSKPRVGGGSSDVVNWATVPLEGMVYSVLHDPPGGDSYAEISAGTKVKIEYSLASSRAAKAGGSLHTEIEKGGKGEFEMGLNLGYTAEVATKILKGEFEGAINSEIEFTSPEFSVSSNSDDSWDITFTTQRILRSSQDAQLPGRAGDAILGAGIELLYTMSDVLDFAPTNGVLHCLESNPAVTWLPRKPTSYFVNVHEIEAKILPNLRFLRSVAMRGDIQQDDSRRPLSVNIENMTAVNEDWSEYITQKIDTWERTLRWASPAERESLSSIIGSYTGSDSIIGDHLRDKVEDFSDAFHEPFSLTKGPMADLAEEWVRYGSVEMEQILPVLALSASVAPEITGLTTAFAALSGPLVFVSEHRLLKYMDAPGTSLTYPRDDETVPDYNAILKKDHEELFYSFAMNAHAQGARETPRDFADSSLDAADAERMVASLTGGQAQTGVQGSDERADVFLTFSGGGNSIEFSFSSDESLSGSSYGFTLEVSGGFEVGGGFGLGLELAPGLIYNYGSGAKGSFERSSGRERVFAWDKRGQLTTTYFLGDPDVGDKFVIKVGSDTRFGTPIFETLGGRSKCPGELGTVFREGGVSLRVPLNTGTHTTGLNPNQIAIYEVVIENESPYREASMFALRIVDGLRASIDELISVAYSASDDEPTQAINRIKSAAALTAAKNSKIVMSMVRAAELAAADGKSSAEIAETMFKTSSAAPYEGSELADSKFSINGNLLSIGDYMPLSFIDGDSLERQQHVSQLFMNLAVEPGYSTRNINYLQLRLSSLCESHMGSLYREAISFTRNLEPMSWEQTCPKVQFDQSTISRYLTSTVSKSTSSVLSLVVNNPEQYVLWPDNPTNPSHHLMNPRLRFVRLQYRPVTGGEWITAKDKDASAQDSKKFNFLCPYSRSDGCRFDWDTNGQYEKLLSGFKDGVYELRVKSFCGGASSLADISVHEYASDQRLLLTVDTVAPVLLKTYMTMQYYGAEFAEEIDCSNIRVRLIKRRADCSSTTAISEKVDATIPPYEIRCFNSTGRGLFSLKFDASDVGRYTVSVEGINDGAGISALPFSENVAKCQAQSEARANAALGESAPSGAEVSRIKGARLQNLASLISRRQLGAGLIFFVVVVVVIANVSARFRIGGGSSAIRERAPFLTSLDSVRRDYGAAL